MRGPARKFAIMTASGVVALLSWAYYPSITTPGDPLTFKIEGILDSKLNFRDAGASINECAGKPLLPEGKLLRASGFFSGWNCDRVGSPNVIYTLNYSDKDNRKYYCRGQSDLLIGTTYQHEELSDLEFIKTWDTEPAMVKATCSFLHDGIRDFQNGHKALFHCEAGRDRTGAVIALLAAWELEEKGALSDDAITAIECDYRKSKSLSASKYGRVETLLKTLRQQGGVRKFIETRCGTM